LVDGTDLTTIAAGKIAVTPLSLNLTDVAACNALAEALNRAKSVHPKSDA
jgi:hypothetical protein